MYIFSTSYIAEHLVNFFDILIGSLLLTISSKASFSNLSRLDLVISYLKFLNIGLPPFNIVICLRE
jgi:hypothetical protein